WASVNDDVRRKTVSSSKCSFIQTKRHVSFLHSQQGVISKKDCLATRQLQKKIDAGAEVSQKRSSGLLKILRKDRHHPLPKKALPADNQRFFRRRSVGRCSLLPEKSGQGAEHCKKRSIQEPAIFKKD
ncbi:MAG: hypothetical protein LUQ31_02760, partial [Methanoregula sp.]|nr:hypothetical protein [Methanoregula sp.]